jgi:hypothetical protein
MCGKTHNSRGLPFCTDNLAAYQKHLSRSHKVGIDYIKAERAILFPHEWTTCCFCGDEAQFVSLNVGYKIICSSDECIKKSTSPNTVEYEVKVNGLAEEEAVKVLAERSAEQRKKAEATMNKLRETDPDFDRKNSRHCLEFWERKGHTREEAEALAYDAGRKNRERCAELREEDPGRFAGTLPTQVEYWTRRKFTPEAAAAIVSQRQQTFSLEQCVDKFGRDKGLAVWLRRQEKWQETLDAKTDEEKLEINRKKLTRSGAYSKASQEMFRSVLFRLRERGVVTDKTEGEVFFYEHGGEQIIRVGENHFKPDFIWGDLIIEFDGDYWNGSENNREKDRIRNDKIRKAGYKMLNIKEYDFKKNQYAAVEECVRFIEENLKKIYYAIQ